jgi:hypothetical protein
MVYEGKLFQMKHDHKGIENDQYEEIEDVQHTGI